MRFFLLKNRWMFLVGTLGGWALRGYFLKYFPRIEGDTLLYGDIAKNWILHGAFALKELDEIVPTLIRLPGYPAFLGVIFKLFGIDHYTAVLRAQLVIDLVSCFVIAEIARRTISEGAGKVAFLLAAVCPFTANYCAAPLTETLSIFTTASAFFAILYASDRESRTAIACWIFAGLAIAAAILLRPDGGILLAAVLGYLAWRLLKNYREQNYVDTNLLSGTVIITLVAFAPLVPWAIRNWRVFHVFQPLAPRYANAPDEPVAMGFNRWTRTWSVEFVSTLNVFWRVSADNPGEAVDFNDIPSRAFDTAEQRERTRRLVEDYNDGLLMTPELDLQFAQLASERIRHSPIRYYIWLPALRIADMWLRPRTELLDLDPAWWRFADIKESLISIGLAVLNAGYLLCALLGLCKKARFRYAGLFISFILLRSLMLATLENAEPRYTLECFPAVFVLAAAGIGSVQWKRLFKLRTGALDQRDQARSKGRSDIRN